MRAFSPRYGENNEGHAANELGQYDFLQRLSNDFPRFMKNQKRTATGTELADRMAMLAVATPRPHFQTRPNIYFSSIQSQFFSNCTTCQDAYNLIASGAGNEVTAENFSALLSWAFEFIRRKDERPKRNKRKEKKSWQHTQSGFTASSGQTPKESIGHFLTATR